MIQVLDSENQETELLVNEIGAYSGTTLCPSGANLKITANGKWTVAIAPVSTATLMSGAAADKGDSALLYDGEAAIWKITHDGDSNCVVMNTNDGLLINEIGVYAGTIPVSSGPDLVMTPTGTGLSRLSSNPDAPRGEVRVQTLIIERAIVLVGAGISERLHLGVTFRRGESHQGATIEILRHCAGALGSIWCQRLSHTKPPWNES